MPDGGREPSQRDMTSHEFRDAIGRFASGVTIITTSLDGKPFGTTASAVSSLSLDPPMVLICMNESSTTGQAISKSNAFAINILGEDQGELAMHFASKATDKFDNPSGSRVGTFGQPILHDALATLECRVVEKVRGGTHTVFLAAVEGASARTGSPLAYFRGQFGRLEVSDDRGAYEKIRERILDGRIPHTEPVELQALVDELGLPAGALHIALGKLTSEGLVNEGSSGFIVPPVTWESVEQGLRGRGAIELGVIDLMVGRLSEEQIHRLREASNTWTHAGPGVNVSWQNRHDQSMDFHDTLVALAGSPSLVDAYRQLAVPSLLARAFRGYVISDDDEVYGSEHDELIAALEAEEPDRARAAVIKHTLRIRDGALQVLSTS